MLKEYIEKQIDLGLVSSVTPRLQVKLDGDFKGLLGMLSNDGESMIQATHAFLDLAEKRALTMKVDENGSYKIAKGEEVEVVNDNRK
jgi:hypothetical protein